MSTKIIGCVANGDFLLQCSAEDLAVIVTALGEVGSGYVSDTVAQPQPKLVRKMRAERPQSKDSEIEGNSGPRTAPLSMLRLREVESRTGLRRATIYRRGQEGTFPKPVKLGKNSSGWVESEIEGWLAGQVSATRDPGGDV